MLTIDKIDISYGPVRALEGVSIEIGNDEIVSVIGANGAGKSTLMKAIVGIVHPQKGSITFDGERIEGMETHKIIRKGVVLVPEGRRIFPNLTVLENLEVGSISRKSYTADDIDEVYSYFPRLKERQKQEAGTLSGGEQQMLAVGRGMMAKPRLLMLDEPSMGLAPVIVDEVFEAIKKINRTSRIPILLVEQNAYMALEISRHCYVMENGRVKISGPSAEIENMPDIKKAYLGG